MTDDTQQPTMALTPDERAHLLAEHTSNGGVCRRCGRDFPCPTVAALDEVERLRAAVAEVIDGMHHRSLLYGEIVHMLRAALAGEGAS